MRATPTPRRSSLICVSGVFAATLGAQRGVALLVVCASFLAQAGVTGVLGLWGF